MNIAVVSPHTQRNGATTVASLLGLELAYRGKSVCLTHLNSKNTVLNEMFSLDKRPKDRSTEPSKLVKLIRTQVLKAEDVPNYCQNVGKNIDVYSVNDRNYSDEDANYLVNFIMSNFPYEFIVFDVDTECMDTLSVRSVIQHCDLVVFVVTQSLEEMQKFKSTAKQLTKLYSKPSVVVVNRFDREISSVKDVQDEVGAGKLSKETSWLKLRYNPQVTKFSNSGYMSALFTNGRAGDFALVDISNDLKVIGNRVMKFYQKYKTQLSKVKSELRLSQYNDYMENYGKDGAVGGTTGVQEQEGGNNGT